MLVRILHGLAVLFALLSFVLLDRALAQSAPNGATDEAATFASRFSALTDALAPPQSPPAQPQPATVQPAEHSMPAPAQPFALNATPVTEGEVLEKWDQLAANLRSESAILADCRADAAHCPPAAKKFLGIIAEARARDGRARIGVINRAINLAIRPTSDLAQWGVTDRWSAPLETFESGRGDCEDYAIAKYVALREVGMADSELRLVIARDLKNATDHAFVAAHIDDTWVVLDNRHMVLTEDRSMAQVMPLFAFDATGVRQFTTSVADAQRMPTPAATAAAPQPDVRLAARRALP
jgi:predicted transglutaminase-like cysteine proteinase